MKRILRKLSLVLPAVFLASLANGAYGQDSIVYFSGPSFQFSSGEIEQIDPGFDLDGNGTQDFAFQQGWFICTADVPTSGCSSPFYVTASGSNAIIIQRFGQATMLPFGAWIGNPPPTNSTWSNPAQSATVATYYISPRFNTSALVGTLADVGVGYLGVRVNAADGWHYGWIRLQIAPYVGVIDWAYESRPNEPIPAGVIGSHIDSLQFKVDFRGKNRLSNSFGTLILTGNTLRGELTLAGLFSATDLVGPAKVKPIASLGHPLVSRTDFTSFFGDVTLSDSQIVQLLRGLLSVSVDQGSVVGRISPIK